MSFIDDIASKFKVAAPVDAFRAHAWAEYNRLGLPQRRDEAWKYTNLESVLKQGWAQAQAGPDIPAEVLDVREKWRDRFDVLVVDHGQVRLDQSVLSEQIKSCLVTAELLPTAFADGFSHLHAALSQTPLHLRVPDKIVIERPLLIVRWQAGDRAWVSSVMRLELGMGAELDLAEVFMGRGEYLRGEIAFAQLSSHARLDWLRAQGDAPTATHFGEVQIELGAAAVTQVTQINSGSKWSRTTITTNLNEAAAEARVQGLTLGRDGQHIDQRVIVNHHAARTNSSQLFKGVLRDQARGILNGKIYIARNAQQVVSMQANHNLLIGKGAEADTKPELEIYADDVKANHGASIGRLDADKLFYLQSRGLRPSEAERLLSEAFVGDVVMKIERPALRRLAEAQVSGGLSEV